MKRIALLVLVALFAASSAEAATKKRGKAKRAQAVAAQQADPNENGRRLVADSIPPMFPAVVKWFYFQDPENRARYGGK